MKQSSSNELTILKPVLSDIDLAQNALFNLLDIFKKLSRLVINSFKTEGMWIGSSRRKTFKPLGIKWPDEPIKELGFYYSFDIKLPHKKNIEGLHSIKKTQYKCLVSNHSKILFIFLHFYWFLKQMSDLKCL